LDILTTIAAVASIISAITSLFVAAKVVQIGNKVAIKGDGNVAVGGNVTGR